MRNHLFILITATLASSASAQSTLYSTSSKTQGAPFDLVVTEIKRESNKSYLSVPGFNSRTSASSRWLMCAYTDLAIKRGFSYWFVSYPAGKSEVLVVGLTNSKSASAKEVLGNDFTEHTLGKDEPIPVEKLAPLCGFSH